MSENMKIWDALSKTDPKHTKPFSRAGGFKGTATKPIWLIKRLTEQFGPAGTGWGMEKPEFQTVTANDEILVFCTVALWYTDTKVMDGRGIVYGVGGDKVLSKNKNGPFTNDEAFKASYTDALSNAMKQIGMAADIHMGLFEDQKYLREVTQEFAGGRVPGSTPPSEFAAEAKADGLTHGDQSQYQVDRLKKAIAAGWEVTNKTDKGKEDQIFDYLDMARNPDEIGTILNKNVAFIDASPKATEINEAADTLLRWFETEAAKAKAA